MTIHQASGKAAIDWQSFNIGGNAQVNFVQPSVSAIALNRVVGQDASQIFGALRANGQVFLLNPNGVLFAPGAQVSAAGVLASTRAMGNEDFLAGRLTLSGSSAGIVANEGSITAASGGYVALVGAQVRNSGSITVPQGSVHLAAANQVSLQISGNGLTAFAVDQGTLDALSENSGLIKADGGRIFLTADAVNQLAKATVNNTGVIEAQTVENRNGTIVLKGDLQQGIVNAGGTMDASAPHGGDGGFIETSAAHVHVAPTLQLSTRSSGGKTGTWLIDPVDFEIAVSGGDMTGTQLSSNLGSNNVTIQSTSGALGTSGDINVNDVVSWSSNTLTLNAQNNINVNANLNGSGTASLALEYGQGAVASGNTSTYSLASNVKVALPSGNNLSTKLGSDGTVKNFYVITTLGAEGSSTTTDLQGMRAGLTGNYALGADIDATTTSTWQSGQGFTFIGTQGNVFSGNFDGLGHTIDGLFENWAVGYVGLFGKIDTTARVANVHLTNVNISGGLDHVGGLIGYASKDSIIEHVSVQGKISGGNNNVGGVIGFNDGKVNDAHANTVTVTGKNYATGGLIGKQSTNGVTTNADSSGAVKGFYDVGGLIGSSSTALDGLHSSATVTPTGGESGGLVGRASGKISNSYATGNITSVNGDMIGGLVGQADSTITNSYATGNVAGGGGYTGGLVGKSNGSISNSHATGKVDGAHLVGGLAGFQKYGTTVSDSYATGNVSGTLYSIGGLIGSLGGGVTNSYATGNVTSKTDAVGGLIGSWSSGNSPEVKDSYATGTVDGRYAVGGLIGDTGGCSCALINSHATGKVTSSADYVGGLIGYVDLMSISDSYATGDVSGINNVGGLAGQAVDIGNSYATGNISGQTNIGGLVGLEKMGGTISGASYASGNVKSTVEAAGGLVGRNEGTVGGNSYSTSLVVGVMSVGGLVGGNYGAVTDAHTGNKGISGPLVTGTSSTGGLIGYNNATVSNVVATGDVKGSSDYTGGLIGFNDKAGVVSAAKSSGTVSGANVVGGVIGENDGTLSAAVFETGTVSGVGMVGGLVGTNTGTVDQGSYTTQAVTGTANAVGGLVGNNTSTGVITKSYATNSVTGYDATGGLVGVNDGSISTVYAAGSASGHDNVGGLIGKQGSTGSASNVYATTTTSGNAQVGGLIGTGDGKVSFAYASGTVTGSGANVGGFFGSKNGGTVTNAVFDLGGTAQAHANGDFASNGEVAVGKTTDQMKAAATFAGWDLSATGSHNTTWRLYDGQARPLLTYWLTPLTITGSIGGPETHVYDGTVHTIAATGITYTETLPVGHLLGSAGASGKNVGVYSGGSGFYSDQQGYDITAPSGGSLTITPAPLTATAPAQSRPYDGSTAATLGAGQVVLNGFFGGDSATSTALAGNYDNKDVTATSVSFSLSGSDLSAGSGTLLSNYTLPTTVTAAGTITALPVSATLAPVRKTYDGTTSVSIEPGAVTLVGFVSGEGATLSVGDGTFNSKNVNEATTVSAPVLSSTGVGSTNLRNYALPSQLTGTGAIIPRQLTVTLQGIVIKIADGNTDATLAANNFEVGNVVAGESVSVRRTIGRYQDALVGTEKLVTSTLAATDYAEGLNTSLSNYLVFSGDVSAPVGTISAASVSPPIITNPPDNGTDSKNLPPPGLGSNVDSNNEGQLSGNVGTISLPQAFNGVLTTLPSSSVQTDAGMSNITVSVAGRTQVISNSQQESSPLAPAQPSAVSANTRENLLFRRAFSIGDGGIRLPQGVRGSEKDASQ